MFIAGRCPSPGTFVDYSSRAVHGRAEAGCCRLQGGATIFAAGRRPTAMNSDEGVVFDFTGELLRSKRVSDAIFERARSQLGTKGVVDMTGIVGYYSFLAMQLNVAQYQVSVEAKKLSPMAR
jgi:hypothetical protein